MSQLILPRMDENNKYYMSYSQISTWKKSKRDYIRKYFFGESSSPQLQRYGDFGNKVGEALEKNDFSEFTEKEATMLCTVPRYDEFERKIIVQRKGYYIIGYIDTNTKDCIKIADYKTGEIEARLPDYESDDYWQLSIYAEGLRQQTGKLPKEAHVYLIERHGNAFKGEDLTLGERYETIEKNVSKDYVNNILNQADMITQEISSLYVEFLKMNIL